MCCHHSDISTCSTSLIVNNLCLASRIQICVKEMPRKMIVLLDGMGCDGFGNDHYFVILFSYCIRFLFKLC